MFSRVATFALAALPLLAAATPVELDVRGGGGEPPSSCTTGPIQCCNTIEQANQEPAASIIAGLGVVLQDPTVLVGLTCSPVTVIGVGGSGSCNANAVCYLRAHRAASSPSAVFPSSSDRAYAHPLDAYGRTGGVV